MDQRMSKDKYYLNIADAVLDRSTCLRRKYGAIIVKNDEILSTGYNGAPRGRVNCSQLGYCNREQLNIPSGQRYELCRLARRQQHLTLQLQTLVNAQRLHVAHTVLLTTTHTPLIPHTCPNPHSSSPRDAPRAIQPPAPRHPIQRCSR